MIATPLRLLTFFSYSSLVFPGVLQLALLLQSLVFSIAFFPHFECFLACCLVDREERRFRN